MPMISVMLLLNIPLLSGKEFNSTYKARSTSAELTHKTNEVTERRLKVHLNVTIFTRNLKRTCYFCHQRLVVNG